MLLLWVELMNPWLAKYSSASIWGDLNLLPKDYMDRIRHMAWLHAGSSDTSPVERPGSRTARSRILLTGSVEV